MSSPSTERRLSLNPPPEALELLSKLRARIRWYVVVEGLAMLVVCLGAAFWLGLAIDYLPVLVGANEMPSDARAGLLAAVFAMAGWVLYRYIFRRVLCRFHNASLALLVERQFPSFHDSLVTSIEVGERPPGDVLPKDSLPELEEVSGLPTSAEMLSSTMQRAASSLRDVKLGRIFNYGPLLTKLSGATLIIASLVLLSVFARDALSIGVSRLLLLSSEAWPRRAHIEMVGFENGERKIAKGSDLTIRVRADAKRETPPPEVCAILYETVDGDRGRVNMSRDGEPRDGYQYYVFSGKPFQGILHDVQFDVIGYDHRLRDQHVRVLLRPVVSAIQLECELPAYTGLLPRREPWTPGIELPVGSRVVARVEVSKDLQSASIKNIDNGEEERIEFSSGALPDAAASRGFVHEIPKLEGRHAVSISLIDTDGIESEEPFFFAIGAKADTIPRVDITLRGIGSAITSLARLPVEGTVNDDYELARTWFDIQVGDVVRQFGFALPGDQPLREALDLRQQSAADQPEPLQLKPDDRVVFSVQAQDRYDLDGEPHVGSSEPIALSVVRPDELLAILDGRELGLRRRFEQIKGELTDSRDSLLRLRASWREPESELSDNAEGEETGEEASVAQRNLVELRERWTQWAKQKADQSTSEVAGVTMAFEDIREELINNRVDTPERKSRLEEQIIAPLRTIADEMFPEYGESLGVLEASLSDPVAGEAQTEIVVEQASRILVAMEEVLQKMLELEDYAELVNLVRSIIEQQEQLIQETKDQQQRRVLELLR